MARGIVGILDVEEAYVNALCNHLSKKGGVAFDIVSFSSIDSVREFTMSATIDLLLCGQECFCPALEQLSVDRFVLLCDEIPPGRDENDYPMLYRYQPVSKIWQEILLWYELKTQGNLGRSRSYKTDIYTIYSPVSRCGKTNFSLALSKVLGEKKRTLYLNFEEYACLSPLVSEEEKMDLSDALFYFEKDNLGPKLPKLIQSLQGFHLIWPAHCPADIRNLTGEKLAVFLETLLANSHYDALVIDAGNALPDISPLLEKSSVLFMPIREDPFSLARVEKMEQYYASLGEEEVVRRTRKIVVPFCQKMQDNKRHSFEQLFWGELPDFTRSLL